MRTTRIVVAVLLVVLLLGMVAVVADEEATEEKKKKKKKGVRKGAMLGAITGLALGAATGDAEFAAAGAAAGAIVGAGAGAMYEYDQSKQDDRTMMMADAVASNKETDAKPGETVGDVGKRHMESFLGDWKMDIWVLGEDGEHIPATGQAKGIAAGESGARVMYRDVTFEGAEESFEGTLLMTYDPGQGFFLENSYSYSDEELKFVGEYLADRNAYNYYLTNNTSGEMVSGGVLRSNMRVEVRVSGAAMWVAEAYTHIDGKEVLVQSYRFTRP